MFLPLVSLDVESGEEFCPRCDRQIKVVEVRWQCLLRRNQNSELGRTPVVFFQLNASKCNSKNGRNTDVRLPEIDPQRAGEAGPVYILKQWQLRCLAIHSENALRQGEFVVFDFLEHCKA